MTSSRLLQTRIGNPMRETSRPAGLRRGAWLILLALLLSLALAQSRATEFRCATGRVSVADIGEGVVMRTCLWEKEPSVVIRTGPLELIKNNILILQTQTNPEGRLHGLYSSWYDSGRLMEQGHYREGLKQGPWVFSDANGSTRVLYYRSGVPLGL